jgi:hypothetical protein
MPNGIKSVNIHRTKPFVDLIHMNRLKSSVYEGGIKRFKKQQHNQGVLILLPLLKLSPNTVL